MNIDAVLVAEFKLEKGSEISAEYPEKRKWPSCVADVMLPDGIHQRDTDWTYMILENTYLMSFVSTRRNGEEKRGARVMAMAICSPLHFLHVFKPLLLLAAEKYAHLPDPLILKELHEAINSIKIPKYSPAQQLLLRGWNHCFIALDFTKAFKTPKRKCYEPTDVDRTDSETEVEQPKKTIQDCRFKISSVSIFGMVLKIRIPLYSLSFHQEIGEFSMIKFIKMFESTCCKPYYPQLHTALSSTPGFMLLINAVLLGKRIIFVGHNIPANDVCECVFALCAAVTGCGIVYNNLSRRIYPYATLKCVDELLSIPGYIAGTTNPFFETQTDWWDIMVTLPKANITVSPKIGYSQLKRRKSISGVTKPMLLMHDFCSNLSTAICEHRGENHVRLMFAQHMRRIFNKEFNLNPTSLYKHDYQTFVDVHQNTLNDKLVEIIDTLLSLNDEEILDFLSFLPMELGGLDRISIFFDFKIIRRKSVLFFQKLQQNLVGSYFVECLGNETRDMFFLMVDKLNKMQI